MKSNLLLSHLHANKNTYRKFNLAKDFKNLIEVSSKKDIKNIQNSEWVSDNTNEILENFNNKCSTSEKEDILKIAIKDFVLIMTTESLPNGRNANSMITRLCKMKIVFLFDELFESYINAERDNLIAEYSFWNIIKKVLLIKK